ncbi:unnamed protein product, partial [Allacma fusca]
RTLGTGFKKKPFLFKFPYIISGILLSIFHTFFQKFYFEESHYMNIKEVVNTG